MPNKTIDEICKEFLTDQEARLSPNSFNKYKSIIQLYQSYLESYWPSHSEKEYDSITEAKGTYCETFGAADITAGFSEFLGYFMPRKVMAGNETMKAAGTVIKKLSKWLVEKGHTQNNTVDRELLDTAARDLPASQKVLDLLDDWLSTTNTDRSGREIEGHFSILRTGSTEIWLEEMMGSDGEIGPIPIPVPARIAKACKVGWDVGGVVAQTKKGWRLVEIWNLSP